MKHVFADAFYFFAILNRSDPEHQRAIEFSRRHTGPILTTAWVLTEVADGLASTANRPSFTRILASIRTNPDNEIVAPNEELFTRGIQLYDARPDKKWPLTDCISFVVMQDRGITEALTGDHHFEQAGFRMLLG